MFSRKTEGAFKRFVECYMTRLFVTKILPDKKVSQLRFIGRVTETFLSNRRGSEKQVLPSPVLICMTSFFVQLTELNNIK